jgi:superfamily I DNA/RNA helicase
MYPDKLSDDVVSEAERLLYEWFRDQLDNSYIVFHQVSWQALDGQRRPRDGEADFIIAHPQRGIMVLEAKGGAIRCDPSTGAWTSTDHSGQIHSIKDPFYQARQSKYALLEQIEKMLNMSGRRINIVDAVAFPDVVIARSLPGLNMPRDIIMDQTDLLNVSRWVGKCLAYRRGGDSQRDTAPGQETMEALMQLLGKTWELRPALWGEFRHEQIQFIRLTEQQYIILDALNRRRRVLISGCAGSGKTMLAVEKARRLAQQKFRVLFTCFNKSLAMDLRRQLPISDNFQIFHFHGLCYDLANKAGTLPTKPPKGDTQKRKLFVKQQLPEALMKAVDRLQHIRYDAIIVDEGQDFREDWWIPLQMLLRDPDEGILYIFFDDNQRIYDRLDEFPIQDIPYPLTVNCRNTQNIHKQVVKFYNNPDSVPAAQGPLGRPVEIVYLESDDQLHAKLQEIIRNLIEEEQVPNSEIVVLSPVRQNSQLWTESPSHSSIILTDTRPPRPGQVFATTIHDFKGLESAVIILVEIERWPSNSPEFEPLLYVACSRARNHLIAILSNSASTRIRKQFG